jgi:hypothetical protein
MMALGLERQRRGLLVLFQSHWHWQVDSASVATPPSEILILNSKPMQTRHRGLIGPFRITTWRMPVGLSMGGPGAPAGGPLEIRRQAVSVCIRRTGARAKSARWWPL